MEYIEKYDFYDYKKGGILEDCNSSIVALILNIYQMENFCYKELNRSSRFKDTTKVATLGPWAAALFQIIASTQKERKDLVKFDHNKEHNLFRGGGLTQEEIN